MSFEKGNPPCRKRTTVGNRSGVILPRRVSAAAVRTPTGQVVITAVVRPPTIVAVAVSGVETIPGGPNAGRVARVESTRPTIGGASGNRAVPLVVPGAVSAAMTPPRPAGRGAGVVKNVPRGAGIRGARTDLTATVAVSRTGVVGRPVVPAVRIGRVPGGFVLGARARRTGRVAVISVTRGHDRGGATAGRAGHGAAARKGRGGGRPPAAGKVTAVRAGVRRSAAGNRDVARAAVEVSTDGHRDRRSRTCRTRFGPPTSTRRFGGICSVWTRAMPKSSPGIW